MKKNNFDKIFNEISNYYDKRVIKYNVANWYQENQ